MCYINIVFSHPLYVDTIKLKNVLESKSKWVHVKVVIYVTERIHWYFIGQCYSYFSNKSRQILM